MNKKDFNEIVGGNIASQRVLAKLSQADLSAKIGISRSALGMMETGNYTVDAHKLHLIARELDTTVNNLLHGTPGMAMDIDSLLTDRDWNTLDYVAKRGLLQVEHNIRASMNDPKKSQENKSKELEVLQATMASIYKLQGLIQLKLN